MSNIWFTADTHFGHRRIMDFCPNSRPFKDEKEMNYKLIERWNQLVNPHDIVYHLGDVSFEKADITTRLIKQLNGHIHLIKGNHDKWLNKDNAQLFESIGHYKKIKMGDTRVIMFHYPIARWDQGHYGSYHLYGHEHGNYELEGKALDVGIDNRPNADFSLWHWDEIDQLLKDKPNNYHHT